MREREKNKVRILRCEAKGCRRKLSPGEWCKGWYQGGTSRFGTKYDPDELASWCPIHHHQQTRKLGRHESVCIGKEKDMLGYAIVMKKKWVDVTTKESKNCPQPFIVTCCKFSLDSIIAEGKINMKAYRRLRIPITLPEV